MAAVARSRTSPIQEIFVGNHFFRAIALLCFSAAPQGLLAQASDPGAAVPALVYLSVLEGGSKGVVSNSTDWKKANEAVGQFRRGHIDVLKWEEQAQSSGPPDAAPANRSGGTRAPMAPRP
jgi:hypothetical protein